MTPCYGGGFWGCHFSEGEKKKKAEREENPNLSQVGEIPRQSPHLRASKTFSRNLAVGWEEQKGAPDGFSRRDFGDFGGFCCSVWPKQLLLPNSVTLKNLPTKALGNDLNPLGVFWERENFRIRADLWGVIFPFIYLYFLGILLIFCLFRTGWGCYSPSQ